ncbi:STE/STE20/MST protein kinase [Spizellomyces punctatus DAOM BR117]|uniref:non-specific serine/threonine protein kinase n=1 Tax=Spizellomyces punctatus (strain DAOM BR117) TaxID=645134 RepID=A0A0L0H5B1_SPIPD|nr:STE/STE20/MST protein kinase [Spizellomyces punctatus DAOM BR117]KNC96149.1 STE/STE20/MST protein kinase [Spizellomyces punctatus DAOM BR117]|eukprot:XP_016604189.1 STE/STE20/MST protein kinase [Spizellomyces punctatus DAOM BR117]
MASQIVPSLLTKEELASDPTELFTVLGKLGEGSYGSVHKALHKRTSTVCAIKLIPAENDLDDTVKEINIMNGCDSSYVVQFYGSYIKEGYLWIVMEYCGAGSVSDIMRICGRTMTEGQIAVICRNVLEGLKYLHERRKIHRDIKAGNILLNTQGEAKLADFGVAGQLSDNQAKRNTVIGTPFWMAPEVIQEVGYGVLADIWSLGITCIEMAEGRPPYHKIHPMRAIFMIPTKPPPRLQNEDKWSKQFIDFIAQCLTKNPSARPSAEQLLQHPFITEAPGIAVMSETVSEVMDLIAKGALDDDESDAEQSDEDAIPVDTVRLDHATIKQARPGSPRRAFDELPTVGPQAAARRAEEARRHSGGETSEEDEDSLAYGTVKLNGKAGKQPTDAGRKVLDDFFDSYASGTMLPAQGGMGTMVINDEGGGYSGTMVINKNDVDVGTMRTKVEEGSPKRYQPAFMKYLGKGTDAGALQSEPSSSYEESTMKPRRPVVTASSPTSTQSPRQPTTTTPFDLINSSSSLESLQELLDLVETNMEKELEATRLKYEKKRGPILDAINAKKAALGADGGNLGVEVFGKG